MIFHWKMYFWQIKKNILLILGNFNWNKLAAYFSIVLQTIILNEIYI